MLMVKALLITRPDHDLTTNYLFFWSEKIIAESQKKNISLMNLAGKKAVRGQLESYLKARKPALVVFNGHGNKDIITGQDNEPLIVSGENEEILAGAIVYARSCEVGLNLGPSLVKNGNKISRRYETELAILNF